MVRIGNGITDRREIGFIAERRICGFLDWALWWPLAGCDWRMSRDEALADIARDRDFRRQYRRRTPVEMIYERDIPDGADHRSRSPKPPRP